MTTHWKCERLSVSQYGSGRIFSRADGGVSSTTYRDRPVCVKMGGARRKTTSHASARAKALTSMFPLSKLLEMRIVVSPAAAVKQEGRAAPRHLQ